MTDEKFAVEKSETEWRNLLSADQFRVLREHGTERAGTSPLNYEKRTGQYDCAACGHPLFESSTKYESGSGWPSFTVPVDPANIVEKTDSTYGMVRTEVRSAHGDSHLGHLFDDGPAEEGGLRYCINSAAMRFVPLSELDEAGYGEYTHLFQK